MPRKYFRRFLPDADKVRQYRLVMRFGASLQHPNLWHLNRDSVSRAVAIGLFGGLVPGPLQVLTVVLLAIPLHCNLPVGILVTFYTNPLTIVPIYLLAYELGKLLLGSSDKAVVRPFEFDWSNLIESMRSVFDWMISLGPALAVGLVALALTLALAGYVVTRLGWRAYVVIAWRRRAARRARRS
jgi:uncharacterized protein (DUF2062 family)